MKLTESFIPSKHDSLERIIVYGASHYGEMAYFLLRQYGFRPAYYVDRNIAGRKVFDDIDVISADKLSEYKDACIIIASADCFHEMYSTLKNEGYEFIYDLEWLLSNTSLDGEPLSEKAKDIYKNHQNYIDVVHKNRETTNLFFTRINYVVSEKCSLKCIDCSHLMQYYKKPKNIDLKRERDSFERLLSITDSISELRILGGEPFINQNMYKVIEWWNESEIINKFIIYSNGTIIPRDECMRWLMNDKVEVRISDYGKVNAESVKKLSMILEEKGIEHHVMSFDNQSWQDSGNLHCRKHSKEMLKKKFSSCFERNCISFLHGKLFRCPRSSHLINLHAMPDIKTEYVDFNDDSLTSEELLSQVKKLQSADYIEACNYCDGCNRYGNSIPAAIQTKEPLQYEEVF